ncbi:hypothetical protein ACH5RR_012029 [Cinchona calisaya]|uniref:Uncharacterized protein n=1 Tax=Cinchona calisaya TaxID=153742 RepID=A0ABD3ACG7_9GENT
MGGCLSKKRTCSSCPTALANPSPPKTKTTTHLEKNKVEEEILKKEVFITKHRKSQDIDRKSEEEDEKNDDDVKKAPEEVQKESNGGGIFVAAAAGPVRTSSCTKEEVDAILIQCGRLSRSSSTGKPATGGRKYSGSKRSYDFDNDNCSDGRDGETINNAIAGEDDNGVVVGVGERSSHRQRTRQRESSSRTVGSPSKGRRRTPSREREQQRSGSRERGSGGNGGRRVSRSPGRRSESPINTTTTSGGVSGAANSSSGNGNVRPGKMVSVPATVSSLAMDKSNNVGGSEVVSTSAVKRIQVKRNAGAGGDGNVVGGRTATASPRARSPARTNVKVLTDNQNQSQQQQPGSLSRSNSRKAEHSPYRRNPLSEIDTNVVIEQMPLAGAKAPMQKPISDCTVRNDKVVVQGTDNKISCSQGVADKNLMSQAAKAPQAVTRCRSSRLSRDLDINPETLSNPSPSYTTLLLEDIQNFHQKSSSSTPAISLPPCLSKACSILEAVADLNSTSNLSSAFSEDKKRVPTAEQFNKRYDNASFGAYPTGKKGAEAKKDPFVQSEVVVNDDIMEPTFHKYVTVRRGAAGGEDMEEQESSGSNSIVSGQQYWISPSSWEPNSADSNDCWTSSMSNIREDNLSPLGFQRHAISESGHAAEEARRRPSGMKKDSDQQQNGIGRGRIGLRGIHSVPTVTAAST